ncbi:N-formylglutamate amidohydrolase [Caulobacter ginsengisoli]|uniref:N-formylglutamate amidohydrolase n=1 Tax=Caulobacter ginsengisoli TaxID=400775 RepID=A0ABU0ISN2_9CAUL|nr:N-formylglutamate amidohydrolase [Caulobacter ginsengisoli]MDQ0465026.1 N-formylglutamate amidohydrolase [Caulobacter ginsengisoli]
MNAIQPPGALVAEPPFAIARPGPEAPSSPLVFASPHSGSIYPAEMMAASMLDAAAIRRSEDALVDRLVEGAPAQGATLITARLARAWIDVNREPWELDQGMFEDELPDFAKGRTARVAAGLGSIAKVVSEGREIYARKLTFAEARERVDSVHRPYHDALARLLAEARAAHGLAILIDWHSMPAAAGSGVVTTRHGRGCDIVLGDRFGAACAPVLTTMVERELEAMGYRCARNSPYAGGYTTEHYGRPARKTHALQIEINRALYLDEATLEPTEGLAKLKADIERVTGVLAAEWKRLK